VIHRELVENVRRVAKSGEQDDRPAGAAEIEHLQLHAVADRDELNAMRRRIDPGR
jgi:hypothetical protein